MDLGGVHNLPSDQRRSAGRVRPTKTQVAEVPAPVLMPVRRPPMRTRLRTMRMQVTRSGLCLMLCSNEYRAMAGLLCSSNPRGQHHVHPTQPLPSCQRRICRRCPAHAVGALLVPGRARGLPRKAAQKGQTPATQPGKAIFTLSQDYLLDGREAHISWSGLMAARAGNRKETSSISK